MVHQEVAANNLANITTTGFKSDRPFLKSFLDAELAAELDRDKYNRVLDIEDIKTNFAQGLMEQTDNPLNLAIMGDGFFSIQTPTGVMYTRNGNFSINAEAKLVNSEGYPVLGENGPITIREGDIFVNEKGEISIEGVVMDTLRITDFARPYNLKKAANNCFVPADPSVVGVKADNFKIHHRFLERSNVIPVQEMMNMIIYFRNYEADTRIIQAQDDTLRRAVNDVGRPA